MTTTIRKRKPTKADLLQRVDELTEVCALANSLAKRAFQGKSVAEAKLQHYLSMLPEAVVYGPPGKIMVDVDPMLSPVLVDVTPTPTAPISTQDGPICADLSQATLAQLEAFVVRAEEVGDRTIVHFIVKTRAGESVYAISRSALRSMTPEQLQKMLHQHVAPQLVRLALDLFRSEVGYG